MRYTATPTYFHLTKFNTYGFHGFHCQMAQFCSQDDIHLALMMLSPSGFAVCGKSLPLIIGLSPDLGLPLPHFLPFRRCFQVNTLPLRACIDEFYKISPILRPYSKFQHQNHLFATSFISSDLLIISILFQLQLQLCCYYLIHHHVF